jgi:hypothetical protein
MAHRQLRARSCREQMQQHWDFGSKLLDHLIGAGEQRRWHGEAERLGGVEIDDQFELRGLLHG